uniref:Transposase n=1 Tax=Ascaris lumbricoides TaxID=6252 RepID=A0A0M3HH71_ASCLU
TISPSTYLFNASALALWRASTKFFAILISDRNEMKFLSIGDRSGTLACERNLIEIERVLKMSFLAARTIRSEPSNFRKA